jgi:hypothetical protein
MCKRTSRMNAPIVQVRKGTHYLGCDWLLAPIFWPPRGGAGGLGSHRAGQKQLGRFFFFAHKGFCCLCVLILAHLFGCLQTDFVAHQMQCQVVWLTILVF